MAADPVGNNPLTDKDVSDAVTDAVVLVDTDKTPSDEDGEQPTEPPDWNDDEPEPAISPEAEDIWNQARGD